MVDIAMAKLALSIIVPEPIRGNGTVLLKIFEGDQRVAPLTDSTLKEFLALNQDRGWALGFTPALRTLGFSNVKTCTNSFARSQGAKKDCVLCKVLKVDFDSAKLNGKNVKSPLSDDRKQSICIAIESGPAEADLIIDSGGGIHAYYVLKEPFFFHENGASSVTRIGTFENLNKRMIAHFEALKLDGVEVDPSITDISRVMRLPGSLNFKYGEARLVKIIGGKSC